VLALPRVVIAAVVLFAARPWPDPELRRQFEAKALVRAIEGIGTPTENACVAVQGLSGMWIDPIIEVMREIQARLPHVRPLSKCKASAGMVTITLGSVDWSSERRSAVPGAISFFSGTANNFPPDWTCPIIGSIGKDRAVFVFVPTKWPDRTCTKPVRVVPVP
jgi:hypothetical protein